MGNAALIRSILSWKFEFGSAAKLRRRGDALYIHRLACGKSAVVDELALVYIFRRMIQSGLRHLNMRLRKGVKGIHIDDSAPSTFAEISLAAARHLSLLTPRVELVVALVWVW